MLTVNESQPAPANVGAGAAAVIEEDGVGATGVFEGVGENGERSRVRHWEGDVHRIRSRG